MRPVHPVRRRFQSIECQRHIPFWASHWHMSVPGPRSSRSFVCGKRAQWFNELPYLDITSTSQKACGVFEDDIRHLLGVGETSAWTRTLENSDRFWILILESFSDSDWSSNQSRRRSTSSGMHMLNGCFLFGSSRIQRVISLSSCEAEPHALVSTLCDDFF